MSSKYLNSIIFQKEKGENSKALLKYEVGPKRPLDKRENGGIRKSKIL